MTEVALAVSGAASWAAALFVPEYFTYAMGWALWVKDCGSYAFEYPELEVYRFRIILDFQNLEVVDRIVQVEDFEGVSGENILDIVLIIDRNGSDFFDVFVCCDEARRCCVRGSHVLDRRVGSPELPDSIDRLARDVVRCGCRSGLPCQEMAVYDLLARFLELYRVDVLSCREAVRRCDRGRLKPNFPVRPDSPPIGRRRRCSLDRVETLPIVEVEGDVASEIRDVPSGIRKPRRRILGIEVVDDVLDRLRRILVFIE